MKLNKIREKGAMVKTAIVFLVPTTHVTFKTLSFEFDKIANEQLIDRNFLIDENLRNYQINRRLLTVLSNTLNKH